MSDPAPLGSGLACLRRLQVRSRALKSSFSNGGTGGGGWGVRGIRRRAKSETEESARFSAAGPGSVHDRVGNRKEYCPEKEHTPERLELVEFESLETSQRETVTRLREDQCPRPPGLPRRPQR